MEIMIYSCNLCSVTLCDPNSGDGKILSGTYPLPNCLTSTYVPIDTWALYSALYLIGIGIKYCDLPCLAVFFLFVF